MDVTQLALTWVGWPNGEKLALTCVQIWSRPKWAQVIASARKPWPNGVASRPKFSTCVYLGIRLARAYKDIVVLHRWGVLKDDFFFLTGLLMWRCNKQYIGETKRRLKDRFNEHRRPVDRPTPSSRHTAVSDHFLSDNHLPNDIELIPLELIHSSRDALRKAREAYLIERGQTLEPRGINKREEI